MSRNKQAEQVWRAEVSVPGGWQTLFLDEEQAARYNTDPDAYAAGLHELTKIEYLQWIDLDGAPQCGHRTRGGDLCRNMVGGLQLKSREWKAQHRKSYCAVHAEKPRP